jgi:hypothetical protein
VPIERDDAEHPDSVPLVKPEENAALEGVAVAEDDVIVEEVAVGEDDVVVEEAAVGEDDVVVEEDAAPSDEGHAAADATPPAPDEVLIAAVDVARTALLEITPEATIGPVAGHVVEADHVVSIQFESKQPGYPGWLWTVTLARVDDDADPSVLEVEMLPGDGALIAPDWVPWSERLAEYQLAQELAAATAAETAVDDETDDDETDDDETDDDETDDDEDDLDDDDLDDDVLDDDVLDDDLGIDAEDALIAQSEQADDDDDDDDIDDERFDEDDDDSGRY